MLIERVWAKGKKCLVSWGGNIHIIAPETAVKHRLKSGLELSESEFKAINDESSLILCKDYLYGQIAKYAKSEKGYSDKLIAAGFSAEAALAAIEHAAASGYIDDAAFSKSYVDANAHRKGQRRIRNELRQKGVKAEIVDRALLGIDSEQAIAAAVAKFTKNRPRDMQNKLRLYRHLLGRGFSYQDSAKAASGWFDE